jgi:carbonic anhydrase
MFGSIETLLFNHTDCGFTTLADEEPNAQPSPTTGGSSAAAKRSMSCQHPEKDTRE